MRRILRSYELSLEIVMFLLLSSSPLIDLGYQWIVDTYGVHPVVVLAIITALSALLVMFTNQQEDKE